MAAAGTPIPALGHFVWLGPRLSVLGYLSVRSALDRGGFEAIRLHHDVPALADDPLVQDLQRYPTFELLPIAPEDFLKGEGLEGEDDALTIAHRQEVARRYHLLGPMTSRANVLRLLVLWRDGGVYLDTDAITLRDLAPVRQGFQGFAGLERVAMTTAVVNGYNPFQWAKAGWLNLVREGIRRFSGNAGAAFRRIEHWFTLAPNNAILGATPGNATVARFLREAATMPEAQALTRKQIGPRLLERLLGTDGVPDFRMLPPDAFYPLPPEVCWDYVRDDPQHRLGDRPTPTAYVAHLYDSVLSRWLRGPLDAAHFEATRGRTMLARMVEPYLDDLIAATKR
ncbi:MAG: glycosyltransferase [Bacteroidota bacterium]